MSTAPPTFGVGQARAGLVTHRFSHAAMASVFEVHCFHPDGRYAAQAAQAAFDLADRLEQELSRFIENSDIARINTLLGGQETRVSPSTMECLEIAWHAYDLTGGAFDVSLGSGLERIELLPDELTVQALAAGAQLDLGGIGKGYAVDRMAELLEEWEIPQALLHGGFSSVLALEAPPDRDGWPLTLSEPGGGPVLARIGARRRALSASGVRKGDHIVDPRTGHPARRRAAAWVALPAGPGARTASAAEALSTAFMVQPVDEIESLCLASPGLEAWILPATRDDANGPGLLPRVIHLGRAERQDPARDQGI